MLSSRSRTEVVWRTDAMASHVQIRVACAEETGAVERALSDAVTVFHDVDRTCTRFDQASDLMRANADPDTWVAVAPYCFDALAEAYAAYRRTDGRFDPRVLSDLVRLGYDRSLRFGPPSRRSELALAPRSPHPLWEPEFRRLTREVRLGPLPVDLGGIGKGLAVRWAAAQLRDLDAGFLIDAGGDCICRGYAADGGPWQVGIEDPRDPQRTLAVLSATDTAVATSSVRIRRWNIDGHEVHHLIDPLTGQPGGSGLLAVTVLDNDPASAEVWSKVLFLTGRKGVRTSAEYHGIAALWVDVDGVLSWSSAAADYVSWPVAS